MHWLEGTVHRCYNCRIPQDKAPACARCVRGRRPGPAGEYAMRAASMVVAFSSLLVASVAAGQTPKDKAAPATTKAPAKAAAPTKSGTPAPSAPAPATTDTASADAPAN